MFPDGKLEAIELCAFYEDDLFSSGQSALRDWMLRVNWLGAVASELLTSTEQLLTLSAEPCSVCTVVCQLHSLHI